MPPHSSSHGRPRHGSRAPQASNPVTAGWNPDQGTIDPRLLIPQHPPADFSEVALAEPSYYVNVNPPPLEYGQYHYDPASQSYWAPDSGSGQPGPSSGPPAPDMPFVCDEDGCTRAFERQCDLDKHQNNHFKRRRCDICGTGGAENKDLFRHMWTHHPDEARTRRLPKEEDRCYCGYSGRKDNVKRHKDTLGHHQR